MFEAISCEVRYGITSLPRRVADAACLLQPVRAAVDPVAISWIYAGDRQTIIAADGRHLTGKMLLARRLQQVCMIFPGGGVLLNQLRRDHG